MIGIIYTLSCKETGVVFYVGCTTQDLDNRLASHKSLSKHSDVYLYKFIRNNKIIFAIELLEEIKYKYRSDLLLAEEYWIEQLRQWGFDLKNKSNNTPGRYRKRDIRGSGSLKINSDVLSDAKIYCKKNGILVSYFVTNALKEKLKKDKYEE